MSKISEVRQSVIDNLKNEVATIRFTKKDGTERVMKATLMSTILPDFIESDKPKTTKKVNEEVVACFDIEAKAFRSFRLDSVFSFVSPSMSAGKLL